MATTTCCLPAYQVVTDYWRSAPGPIQAIHSLVARLGHTHSPGMLLSRHRSRVVPLARMASIPATLVYPYRRPATGGLVIYSLPVFGSCRFHLDFRVLRLSMSFLLFASRHTRSGLSGSSNGAPMIGELLVQSIILKL